MSSLTLPSIAATLPPRLGASTVTALCVDEHSSYASIAGVDCFSRKGGSGFFSGNNESNQLWTSLKNRLISLYTAMVDADHPKTKPAPVPAPELQGSLL